MDKLIFIALTGIGATAIMDLWAIIRRQLFSIPSTNWGIVGRWIAYMTYGQFRHDSITTSPTIRGEQFIGWVAHYLIGIGYAAILVVSCGKAWINNPSLAPALAVGMATVLAPFLIMQPAMGAGIAASRTQNPNSVRLQSFINHVVFGLGLYVSSLAVKLVYSI